MSTKPLLYTRAIGRVNSREDFHRLLRLLISTFDAQPDGRGRVSLDEVSALLDSDGSNPFPATDARATRFSADRTAAALSYGEHGPAVRGWIASSNGFVSLSEAGRRQVAIERAEAEGWGDPDPFASDEDLSLVLRAVI